MYNVIILCVIGLSVSYIISDDPSALYIFTSCIIIFCVTITLCVIFMPKVIVAIYPSFCQVHILNNIAIKKDTLIMISYSYFGQIIFRLFCCCYLFIAVWACVVVVLVVFVVALCFVCIGHFYLLYLLNLLVRSTLFGRSTSKGRFIAS